MQKSKKEVSRANNPRDNIWFVALQIKPHSFVKTPIYKADT